MGENHSSEHSSFFPLSPSHVARKVNKLKRAAFRAAEARERLPHSLFWSLVRGEAAEIRELKRQERHLRAIRLGIEPVE